MSNDEKKQDSDRIELAKIHATTDRFSTVVWGGAVVALGLFARQSVEVIAGTSTDVVVRLFADLKLSLWLPTIISALATGGYVYQRRRANLLAQSLQESYRELEASKSPPLVGPSVIDATHQLTAGKPPEEKP